MLSPAYIYDVPVHVRGRVDYCKKKRGLTLKEVMILEEKQCLFYKDQTCKFSHSCKRRHVKHRDMLWFVNVSKLKFPRTPAHLQYTSAEDHSFYNSSVSDEGYQSAKDDTMQMPGPQPPTHLPTSTPRMAVPLHKSGKNGYHASAMPSRGWEICNQSLYVNPPYPVYFVPSALPDKSIQPKARDIQSVRSPTACLEPQKDVMSDFETTQPAQRVPVGEYVQRKRMRYDNTDYEKFISERNHEVFNDIKQNEYEVKQTQTKPDESRATPSPLSKPCASIASTVPEAVDQPLTDTTTPVSVCKPSDASVAPAVHTKQVGPKVMKQQPSCCSSQSLTGLDKDSSKEGVQTDIVDKYSHATCSEDATNRTKNAYSNSQIMTLYLQKLNLQQYLPTLIDNGFECIKDLQAAGASDFVAIGMKLGHSRRLMSCLPQKKQ